MSCGGIGDKSCYVKWKEGRRIIQTSEGPRVCRVREIEENNSNEYDEVRASRSTQLQKLLGCECK